MNLISAFAVTHYRKDEDMAVKQLSVFIENKAGSLYEITKILADGGVNLLTLTMADTKDYGIVRLVAEDTDKAVKVLENAGQTASVRDVCGFKIPDKKGELEKVLGILQNHDINIEYMYALADSDKDNAHFVIRVESTEYAEKVLAENNIEII